MEKTKLILDTDITNEIDDQFALVYLLKSVKLFDIKAITIAPYFGSSRIKTDSIDDGNNLSYNCAVKILKMINQLKYKKELFQGTKNYFYQSKKLSLPAEKIINVAKENDKVVIVAIGALTNLALALYHAPEIAKKIELVWLGGHSFLAENNYEYNFKQDVEAVKYVFNSKVKMTVIPCKNVASQLSTTIYELRHYLQDKGELGEYFCQIFDKCVNIHRQEPNTIGESKNLWDLSAIAYLINKNWFNVREISCPKINDDLSYKYTKHRHKITFVCDLERDKILQDFFIKMGCKEN